MIVVWNVFWFCRRMLPKINKNLGALYLLEIVKCINFVLSTVFLETCQMYFSFFCKLHFFNFVWWMYVLILVKGCCQLAFRMQTPPSDWVTLPGHLILCTLLSLFDAPFLFWERPFFYCHRCTKCHRFRGEPGQKCRQIWQICQLYIGRWQFNFETGLWNYGDLW